MKTNFNNKPNIIYITCASSLSIIVWCIFKSYYIFPNLTFDSYYYIEAAASNSHVSTWPIGYSKFIQLIGIFSHSGNILVTVQYFIFEFSLLAFLLTIRKFISTSETISVLLFIFLFLNPLFLYASNHIMSDILFTGLSILWVTQLMWILFSPNPFMLVVHAFLLLVIFTIRYSALYYPIIAGGTIILSRLTWKWKVFGVGLMIVFLQIFIQYTSYRMEIITGSKQFSYTGGWKQANNALYMYEHTFASDHSKVPEKFRIIDSVSRNYFRLPHAYVDLLDHLDVTKGTWYTSFSPSPLRQYMKISKGIKPSTSEFKELAYFGPFYNDYGNYLIKKYPSAFFWYVIKPNIITYSFPILEIYDNDDLPFLLMNTKFGLIAQKWFNLTTISASYNLIRLRAQILSPYSFIFTLVHIIFLSTLIAFLLLRFYNKLNRIHAITLFIFISICILNFLFFIIVAPCVIRFQFTVIIIEFTTAILFINTIRLRK